MAVERQTYTVVAAILFFLHADAFVLRDQSQPSYFRNQKRGAIRLAEALNALEDQSRTLPRHDDSKYVPNSNLEREQEMLDYFESQYLKNADNYEDSPDVIGNGYPNKPAGPRDYYDYYGDYMNYLNGYDSPSEELADYTYEDDSSEAPFELPEATEEELAAIMGNEENESESEEGQESESDISADDDADQIDVDEQENVNIPEASEEELESIFGEAPENEDTEAEKKAVDWAPSVLGMSGQKRDSEGAIHAIEEDQDGNIHNLSEQEVENLLSSAKEAEVQSVDRQIEMSDVNGQQVAKATEIEDILTDENGDGNTKEILIEHEIPAEEAQQMSDNMSDNMAETEADVGEELKEAEEELNSNLERMAALTREVFDQYPGLADDDFRRKRKRSDISESFLSEEDTADLAKECLLRYILLEDAENTDLADALDWATRAQYEGNENYIPMQVDYLRKAVLREQLLQQLQSQCLQLLGLGDLGAAEQEGMGEPDMVDMDKRIPPGMDQFAEGRPRKRNGEEFLPEAIEEYQEDEPDTDELVDELMNEEEDMEEDAALEQTLEDSFTQYLAEQLQQYMEEQKQQENEGDFENEVIPQGTWYDEPISDEVLDDQEKEWILNPIFRQLMEKYQEQDINSPEEYAGLLESPYYAQMIQEELADQDDGMCAAVEDLTDNCAYATAYGWRLDEEALSLCNRHQLCLACGEAFGITAEHCDIGYQVEAYRACSAEEDELTCIEEADTLFRLMTRVHLSATRPRLECQAPCVQDYITGDYFKK